ncbi:MAG: hypothetical protein AAGF92_14175 [Myxococcota bacterium]
MDRAGVSKLIVLMSIVWLQGASCEGSSSLAPAAELRVAHLAPGVPNPLDTALDFEVLSQGSFDDIQFAHVSDTVLLDADTYFVTASATNGVAEALADAAPRLDDSTLSTVIAYRDASEPDGLNLAVLGADEFGLGTTTGRLVVGHGADDSEWALVDVVDASTGEVLIAGLAFGDQSAPIDVEAGELEVRFDGVLPSADISQGPFLVTVEPDELLLLFIIDVDTNVNSVNAELYGLGPRTIGSIDPLPKGMP